MLFHLTQSSVTGGLGETYPQITHFLVSILIPTRNRLDYLKKCVDSIVSKTIYDNYEIIILDNESN